MLVRRSTLEDVFLHAHRPDARRLMATVAVTIARRSSARSAVTEWHARTLQAHVARDDHDLVPQPVLFLLSVGVLLGS